MVLIVVKNEDKEKVLGILLGNGKFRSLGENMFDIIEHSEDVIEKIKSKRIDIQIIKDKQ